MNKVLKSFLFFLLLVLFFSMVLYPPFYSKQMKVIEKLFSFYADNVPEIIFSSFSIESKDNPQSIIRNETLSLVIDPENSFSNDLSLGAWIHLTEKHLAFSIGNQRGAGFDYHNPLIKPLLLLFNDLSEEGSGVIGGDYFLDLFNFIKNRYFFPGIFFFIINVFISAFLAALFISFLGFLYSRTLRIYISWREIRNLSYYTLSPVFILLVFLFYLNISTESLSPVIMIFYFLFFRGALLKNSKALVEE